MIDPPRPAPGSVVVCVHGAIVNGAEMVLLRHRLRQRGYVVRQFHWPSLTVGLKENVARLRLFLAETDGETLHVVGHSMGGVLARIIFEEPSEPRPGRMVAIGSPLADCRVGRRYAQLHPHIGPLLVGRSVHDHISHPIDPVWRGSREFGVMAGTYVFGAGSLFRHLPRPSDGVVLLEETRLQGLADHVTFRLNHFGMLFSRRCAEAAARFLETGRFETSASVNAGSDGAR